MHLYNAFHVSQSLLHTWGQQEWQWWWFNSGRWFNWCL